eukprot:1178395-Prorocentrum_minimum.AAC.8
MSTSCRCIPVTVWVSASASQTACLNSLSMRCLYGPLAHALMGGFCGVAARRMRSGESRAGHTLATHASDVDAQLPGEQTLSRPKLVALGLRANNI